MGESPLKRFERIMLQLLKIIGMSLIGFFICLFSILAAVGLLAVGEVRPATSLYAFVGSGVLKIWEAIRAFILLIKDEIEMSLRK